MQHPPQYFYPYIPSSSSPSPFPLHPTYLFQASSSFHHPQARQDYFVHPNPNYLPPFTSQPQLTLPLHLRPPLPSAFLPPLSNTLPSAQPQQRKRNQKELKGETEEEKREQKHRETEEEEEQEAEEEEEVEEEDDEEEHHSRNKSGRKPELFRTSQQRLIWSSELEKRFLLAIESCSTPTSPPTPKAVLSFMQVPGLTRANVSSHLQKHRLRLGQPFVRKPKKEFGKMEVVKGKNEKNEKKKKKNKQQAREIKSPADKKEASSSLSLLPTPSSGPSSPPPATSSFSFSSTVAVPTAILATPSSLPPPLPPLPPKVSFDFLLPRVSSFSLMPNSRTASPSFAFLLEQNQTQHQYQGCDPFLAMGFEYWNSFTSSSSSLGSPSISGPPSSSTKASFSNDSYVW